MMTHRPGTSVPSTFRLQTARPPSVRPIADAMPIGIGWSGASRTPIDPGSWPWRTRPEALALVKYSMALMARLLVPLGGPEGSQQAVEGLLIGIVVLPTAEVPDVPRPFDMRGPRDRAFQDRIIEPDREEHDPFLPPLPLQRSLDFRFNPIAGEGLLREHEHELVVNPD